MHMTIIITMNIYITKENENNLRNASDQSMSGLINSLLVDYFETHPPGTVTASSPEEMKKISTQSAITGAEKFWCKHGADPKFCKHAKDGKVCK